MRQVVLFLPLLALGACKQEAAQPVPRASATPVAAAASATPPVAASDSATASPGGAREVSEQNDLYAFDYAYPAQAGAIPGLKAWLDAEIVKERAELAAGAREARAEAKKEGFPFNAHSHATGWEVVTDLPGWLSLSAAISTYQGGAHPNHWFAGLLWDKTAGQRRAPLDLFASKQALSKAIRTEFCAQIDRQREEKRGEKIDRNSGEMFNDCIDPAEQTLILGSSNRKTFDRIGVLVAPYEAGPYVEGEYEATVPVTAAVIAAAKPEYRAAFSLKR